MVEESKPGCQRPPIKKPVLETSPVNQIGTKEVKPAMVRVGSLVGSATLACLFPHDNCSSRCRLRSDRP
jgi:hypothetical protein